PRGALRRGGLAVPRPLARRLQRVDLAVPGGGCGLGRGHRMAHETRLTTYKKYILTSLWVVLPTASALLIEGSLLERRTGKAEQGVASLERIATARGRTRPASLECDPQEQPLLPGPGNNDNKAPVHPKIATTERREAGISVAGNAGLSPRK